MDGRQLAKPSVRPLLGVVLAAALAASLAVPVAAGDPMTGEPIPPELSGTGFPHRPVSETLALDLDGDGARELLAVMARSDALGLAAVQAWWLGSGGVERQTSEARLRREASVDELLLGRGRFGIDRDNMIALKMDEPAQLFVARRGGRDVPLVATIGMNPDFPVPCCLTIWEVEIEGERLDLRHVAGTQRLAVELIPVDLDADGTDELFVTEGPLDDVSPLEVSLLAWNGDRYMRTGLTVPSVRGCCASVLDAGETDGLNGEEVLLRAPTFDEAPVRLARISLRPGIPHVEFGELAAGVPLGDLTAARVLPGTSGAPLVASDGFSLTWWNWASDQEPIPMWVRPTSGSPVAVFGTGAEARVFAAAGTPPSSLVVVRADVKRSGPVSDQSIGRDTRAGSWTGSVFLPEGSPEFPPMDPFFGLVPGGVPGAADAYIFGGYLVVPVSDAGSETLAAARPIALLPGVEPAGTLGPGGSWTAMLTAFSSFSAFSFAGAQSQHVISLTFTRPLGILQLAATASVLEPERNSGDLAPTFHGVARDPERPATLIVGEAAVDADIAGPEGTMVWWATRTESGSLSIGSPGVARIRLLPPAGPDAPEGSRTTASIWAVTPAGHAYNGSWRISVYRQPPALAITDDVPLIDFGPTLRGRTVPGATVTINGQPAVVAPDGSFAAPIAVGILPTELRVVAIDPVGNRSERVVSRAWPIDYRQLPFVPLAVILTIAVGVALYLRKPDSGPERRRPDDGATFEEIGG